MHQLSRLAYHREIHFEVSRAKALSWQVLRPPPEGGVPALALVMTQRLLQLEALELRRIDVLYSIMAGAAAAAGGGFSAQLASTCCTAEVSWWIILAFVGIVLLCNLVHLLHVD